MSNCQWIEHDMVAEKLFIDDKSLQVTSFAATASVLPIGAHVFQPESRAGGQSSTDSGGCPRHAAATGNTTGL